MAVVDPNLGLISWLLVFMTDYVTGSMDLTLFILFGLFLIACIGSSLPVEISGVLMIPFVLAAIVQSGTGIMMTVLGIAILYVSSILAKYFLGI